MQAMRMLVISDAFWPDHTGGITKSLLNEVEGLVARGHQIVVVTRKHDSGSPRHESRNGYEVYRYSAPCKDSIFYRMYPLVTVGQLPRLARALEISRFEVVYAHNPFQMLAWDRVPSDMPLVYAFHAPKRDEIDIDLRRGKYGLQTPFLWLARPLIEMIEHRALEQADLVVVRSGFMAKQMRSLCGNCLQAKVTRIPLGVNTVRFPFAEDTSIARDMIGLRTDQQTLLTVRRLVGRMGLENLIDAMAHVVRRHPQSLLLVGGEGYLREELGRRTRRLGLEQNIRLLGFIPEETLPTYYQAADLFILPTAELEGFGLATIEALSCGTPTIVTPVGASPEVVRPLDEELICEDTSPEALADRIIWWLDRDVTSPVRRACREYCVSRFASTRVVESLEDVFGRAIRSHQ